jgi:hypothetical protein
MKRQIRDMHERLGACLAELNQVRPTALLNSGALGESFRFRAELPYLDRTFEVFHRLSRRDLAGVPFDLLRNLTADASATLGQVRKITALAEERAENFDEALEQVLNEIKESFDRISANVARALSQRSERSTGLTNAATAVAVSALVGAFAILAYYSSRDRAVADAILRAAHRIGLS